MALDIVALTIWISISAAFIAVATFLYTRVRAKKIDENKDEASAY